MEEEPDLANPFMMKSNKIAKISINDISNN